MLRPDVDIAILGGGCAGLSLAVRLASSGQSLCVLEPREVYTDDRAWSFWRTAPDPFEDCVRASWTHWDVTGPSGLVARGSSGLRYETVAAGPFYDRAQSMLADSPSADLVVATSAGKVRKTAHGHQVDTDRGTLSARHVVDTRSPRRVPTYGQFFLGREIRTERPVFDAHRVHLMQFRNGYSEGVDFVYTLPFAQDRALVEVTSFAPASPGGSVFSAWLDAEIADLDPGDVEILRQESGALPMEVGFAEPDDDSVIRMGLRGGAARPSTGYAFARIQAQADHVADALASGAKPRPMLDSQATRFMDRVFLQVLQTMPDRGPALFESLFRNAPPDRLERFLSGSTHPLDRLSVMTSLPPMPFLRAALTRA
ncbi:lycopene cyclase family protein [Loktanella sp. SALINAS62]|uniref:lycopene cyclase family protein n=1 Tax=Loktanella sp. SALINAS62 TaxID=2706124 RepID=UPI001B8D15AF|nr:lycopene cyclase family protein [Loktanella sp. SALINAS62]MBS1303386.1 lycopene cyclase [Loktanella sp. SALINAS62]